MDADCTDQDHIYIIADNQPYGPYCHPNSRHRRSVEESESSGDDVIPSPTYPPTTKKEKLQFPSPSSPIRSGNNNPYPSLDLLGSHKPTQQEGEMIMISPDNRLSGRLQLPGFQSYGIGNFDNESEQEKEETDESGNFEADRAHHEPGNFFHVPESTKKTTTKRPKPTR